MVWVEINAPITGCMYCTGENRKTSQKSKDSSKTGEVNFCISIIISISVVIILASNYQSYLKNLLKRGPRNVQEYLYWEKTGKKLIIKIKIILNDTQKNQ